MLTISVNKKSLNKRQTEKAAIQCCDCPSGVLLNLNHESSQSSCYLINRQTVQGNRKDVVPQAMFKAAPRDHVDDPAPSKLGWFGTIVLVIFAIAAVGGAVGFGIVFFQKGRERQRKRFY